MDALERVLMEAHAQAATGKGKERHGLGLPFERQPIMEITRQVGWGFPLGQALKKIQEAQVLLNPERPERAVNELLGAVVYLSAAILHLKERAKPKEENSDKLGPWAPAGVAPAYHPGSRLLSSVQSVDRAEDDGQGR